jgi:hypothetical protein
LLNPAPGPSAGPDSSRTKDTGAAASRFSNSAKLPDWTLRISGLALGREGAGRARARPPSAARPHRHRRKRPHLPPVANPRSVPQCSGPLSFPQDRTCAESTVGSRNGKVLRRARERPGGRSSGGCPALVVQHRHGIGIRRANFVEHPGCAPRGAPHSAERSAPKRGKLAP